MSKYAFQNIFGIEGFPIAWYGIIIASGMVLGLLLAMREAKRQGLYKDAILDFILIALPVAILCARAYYVIFEWSSYKNNPMDIIKIWNGGLAIYGGVIGGFLTACVFCKRKNIPLLKFLDIAVPSLVLGQAIGRWGNFVNQEAFGNLVANPNLQFFPYAVYIDALQEWHQATFFYESMWDFAVFGLLFLSGVGL